MKTSLMKTTSIPRKQQPGDNPPATAGHHQRISLSMRACRMVLASAVVLGLALGATAQAQTVTFRAPQARITVPPNSTNTTVLTNWVNVGDLATPVQFDVTGLPAGAGVTLTDTNGNLITSTSEDTNVCLTVTTTNIAEGIYNFSLNGSGGATNNIIMVLQSARVWNGSLGTAGTWSSAANWQGGVPGATSDVVFSDLGAQTNSFTNILVDVDTTVASMRFSQRGLTNELAPDDTARPTSHRLQIATGRTLSITGSEGFRFLRDYVSDNITDTPFPTFFALNVAIGGTNATMVVSNDNANIALNVEAQAPNLLDLSTLPRLVARVKRVGLGDYSLYPNFWNYDANGYNGVPRRFIPTVNFARTNFITALHVDPNNYTNADDRLYSMTFINSVYSGTTAIPVWNLGITNVFLMDSVCLVGANQQGRVQFNPAFATNTPCFAYFRSTNNSRMSMFAISDDAGTNNGGSNIKSFIDFGSEGGSVDILTDRFIMTRDRKLLDADSNFQGQLYMGKGTIDANTAVLGFQEFTSRSTNTTTYRGYCQASITVSNTALFRVHDTLTLGYSVDTDPLSEPWQNQGVINIGPGGTVRAKSILFGGPTKSSSGSAINMTGGATLVVSNTIAGPDGALPTLRMSDSILTLHLNGTNTEPYVYVTNLICGGLSNQINIATLSGVASYPTQYALIKYETATANFSSKIPAGQFGFVLNNSANKTIDVYLFTNAPKTLLWRGNLSANWDTTTANWVLFGTSTASTFSQGDVVVFDDSGINTAINIVDGVFPGGTTLSNSLKNYTFTGGSISGTAKVVKQGSGKLTIGCLCENSLALTNGLVEVTLTGSVGPVTADTGTRFTSAGTAFGLSSLGTVDSSGTVAGPIAIRGGSFLNTGYIKTAPGAMLITNGIMTNALSGVIDVSQGAWNIDAGGVMANLGTINNLNNRVNVNAGGLLFGAGGIIDPNSTAANPDGRVVVAGGALLSPGAAASNSIGTFVVGGRLDLNVANGVPGTMLVEVDFSHPQTNDMVGVDLWNNILGRLEFRNINPGAGAFASGQTFLVASNNNGTTIPNRSDQGNQMVSISPTVPGPGLQWYVGDLRTNGLVGITNGLVWQGSPGGNWDLSSANWQGGAVYNDSRGVLFDDSASGTTTVNLPAAVAPGSNPNDTNNPMVLPALVVSNGLKNYVFTGPGAINGRGGLYKTGPGTLTIDIRTNAYSGPTVIDGGTLGVIWLASWNQPCSIGDQDANGTSSGNRNPIAINNATLSYLGTNTTSDRHVLIGGSGATVDVALGTTLLTMSGRFSGAGSLTKTGPGALQLQDNNNAYLGGTTINDGVLRLTASGAAGTNPIVLAGAALQYSGNGFSLNNAINVTGTGSRVLVTNANNVSGGAWSGTGSVTVSNTGSLTFNASLADFGGLISFGNSSGWFRFNNATNDNKCLGSALASFDLGTGSASLSNFNGAGLTYDLGALAGGASTVLAGRSSNSTIWPAATTYRIGANGSNTVFSGRILNGLDTVSVTKVGSGALLLNGQNGYTGTTTVSAGTLGGTGTILGPVTVDAGGTLSPGTSIGTLTISNTLSLAGTTVIEVSKNGGSLASDRVAGLTSVSFSGALVVNNLGPDALSEGDAFKIFSTGGTGSFSSITPALPGGLTWNFDPASGTLYVGPRIKLNYTVGVGGTNFSFSWFGAGYKLQSQTNTLGVGIGTNWYDYPGGATSPVSVTVDPAKETVFFRLISVP